MIELQLLGSLDLRAPDGRDLQSVLRHPKRLALLAYLAAARPRGFHRRDALLALLWPELDPAHARNALRQSVHFLRDALGHDVIVARGSEELSLDPDHVSCDVVEFEKCLDVGQLEGALSLYRGELLSAFHVSDAPEFERWVDLEREHLRRRALGAALTSAQADAARGHSRQAVRWASRALEISPYDEGALRTLLRLLDESGDRAQAMREYDAFARRLAADLDLEPAPETISLAEAIRGRAEPRSGASQEFTLGSAPNGESIPPKPETAIAGVPLRTRRLAWRMTLGALSLALVGGLVFAGPRTQPSLDQHLLAVAPFEVFDPELALWREGLVDVLARTLDGAGPFRTVSPSVVLRRWEGRTDRESAKALGYRTRAAFVVFGQLLSTGPDSVRLTGTILDARNGQILLEIDRKDYERRMDRLTDSVSVDVIRSLVPTTAGARVRLYSVGTRSLPALKAFLQGEYFFRRFALDSAIASYDRAIAIDTTFPLALRRLQLTLAFNDLHRPVDYYARAVAFNHGLSPRDSLLVLSDTAAQGLSAVPARSSCCSIGVRKFAVLDEAARRYPEDPEIWYQLGENRFHGGQTVGASWNDARAAFDRAIALDSGFAPAYIHPVEISLNDNDEDAALKYVRGYLAISSVTPQGAAMRLIGGLLDSRRSRSLNLDRELEATSRGALLFLGFAVRSWPDENETQIKVWRRLLTTAQSHPTARDSAFQRAPAFVSMVPLTLIHRGRLQEAGRIVGSQFGMPFMELASLGVIPPETVETALDQWFDRPSNEDASLDDRFVAAPCSRTMSAAWWWASRRDTTRLRRLATREESAARAKGRLAEDIARRRPVPGFVQAALALAYGDTAIALGGFLTLPDSLCPNARELREARFRLLAAAGRHAEAAAVFDRSNDRWVPLVLERARLAERLGDRTAAVKYYRFVAQAWLHADPELQPVVAEARAAIARLGGPR